MTKQLLLTPNSIAPSRPDFKVIGIFNPAITTYKDETIMIARVAETACTLDEKDIIVPIYRDRQFTFIKIPSSDPNYDFSDARVIRNHDQSYLTSISHFRVGRSKNGIDFTFDETPSLPDSIYEEYGIEDPRITFIDGRYYITYTAVSAYGINVALMVTDDFKSFKRLGNILPFDNKDCVIFPEKIKGKYRAYHRPSTSDFGKLDIWVASSDNLLHWGEHHALTGARPTYGTSKRLGAGAVPFKTEQGWILIYHSADAYHRYHLAALLIDKDDPTHIIKRSKRPLIEPSESYERDGIIPDVIFTCGLINDDKGISIYYGAGDQNIALCRLDYDELYDNLEDIS